MSQTVGASGVSAPGRDSVRQLRPARWRGRVAIAAVLAGFIAGQGAAVAIIAAGGGDDASDAVAPLALVLADLIMLAIVIAVARRGADRLGPATFGVRRTRFWPAVGWALASTSA